MKNVTSQKVSIIIWALRLALSLVLIVLTQYFSEGDENWFLILVLVCIAIVCAHQMLTRYSRCSRQSIQKEE